MIFKDCFVKLLMANTQKSKIFGATKPGAAPTRSHRKGFAGYDIIGNIVIVKFGRGEKVSEKKKVAERFLKEHKNVRTVLEKSSKFRGRLRTQKTKWLAGEKTKEALYKENDCVFRLNVDTCYFSPRLSSERKEIALKVKKGERVLVMFGGVAPFAIVVGKLSRASEVVSVELGRDCNKYAKENVKRNNLRNVEIVGGDVRRVFQTHLSTANSKSSPALTKRERVSGVRRVKLTGKFDRVVMARPNLKDSFLDVAFRLVKKGGTIYYYGFYLEGEKKEMKEMIQLEAKKACKKIRILKVKKAGEVAAYRYRWRVDLKVI